MQLHYPATTSAAGISNKIDRTAFFFFLSTINVASQLGTRFFFFFQAGNDDADQSASGDINQEIETLD